MSDSDLDDLRDRLRRTRWATPWPTAAWAAGTDGDELHRLVEYWATKYDWRTHEDTLEALPSNVAVIDETPIYYLRYNAEVDQEGTRAIVLSHGWPSSVLELVPLAERLSKPSQYGGRPEDACTVIVPSLPGFGFSPQRPTLPDAMPTHELWHRLMHDELGFEQYIAHGGDLGAGITSRLGRTHPEAVTGIHVLAVAAPTEYDPATLTGEEQAHLDRMKAWMSEEGGYNHQQSTRPLTLAAGLSDSPTGLLAWILEKYRAWSDSHGDVSTRFSDDFLLTQASLYWFTNAISTSFRPYYEYAQSSQQLGGRVEVPTAVALFPADIAQPPRSWAERANNVTRFTTMPRGGHFAAHEEPALLAEDIQAFLRTLP